MLDFNVCIYCNTNPQIVPARKCCELCDPMRVQPFELPRYQIEDSPGQRVARLEKRAQQLRDELARVEQEIHDLRQWGE